MGKLLAIIAVALLITLSGCTEAFDEKSNFEVVDNNVTIWEDSTGEYNIVLAFEVSNLINAPLNFKESNFDIIDDNGSLIDTMQSVSAYPPVVNPDKTAVYFDVKISDRITDSNIKLKAIPHIETEKSNVKQANLSMKGITGWRGENAIGIVRNNSSRIEYNNVHIAIISRTQSNEVVSVMTATIDSIKPGEHVEFEAEDPLKHRKLGSDMVTTFQNFAYIAQ